ncbi:MAG: hypothetical protein EZS28_055672 [Streblomastix strix]|uniref:Uncharacterized protein n=1 Tax=Streblomastix strix TaxID=222440 RepID=A0A5J4PW99_9EUKA|nr:MAG: hypothetical protein EZS28_055672 [Streblomastix strix]
MDRATICVNLGRSSDVLKPGSRMRKPESTFHQASYSQFGQRIRSRRAIQVDSIKVTVDQRCHIISY